MSRTQHVPLTFLFVLGLIGAVADVQAQSAPGGVIHGAVTTQSGTIPLGGVQVSVSDNSAEVASALSDGDGKYRFEGLLPGDYKVVAKMDGFEPLSITAKVGSGR